MARDCGDGHDLPAAGQRHEHRRDVGCGVVERLPHRLAGGHVVGDDRGAAAARLHDDLAVHDQRRGRHAPLQVLGAGVAQDVGAPDQRSGVGPQGLQLAGGTERVEDAVGVGRRGARAVAAHRFREERVPAHRPPLASGPDVVGGDHFAVSALLDRVGQAARDDERGVALANRLLPQQARAAGRPRGGDAALAIDAVAGRAAIVGPRTGAGGRRCRGSRWRRGRRRASGCRRRGGGRRRRPGLGLAAGAAAAGGGCGVDRRRGRRAGAFCAARCASSAS